MRHWSPNIEPEDVHVRAHPVARKKDCQLGAGARGGALYSGLWRVAINMHGWGGRRDKDE
jgi:hypothetical protein